MLLLFKPYSTQENTNTGLLPESVPSCQYPLDIKTLFPYWVNAQKKPTDPPSLVTLLEEYYKWLYCNTKTDITPYFGFFELDKLKNFNNISQKFIIERFIKTYLPFCNVSSFCN